MTKELGFIEYYNNSKYAVAINAQDIPADFYPDKCIVQLNTVLLQSGTDEYILKELSNVLIEQLRQAPMPLLILDNNELVNDFWLIPDHLEDKYEKVENNTKKPSPR